MEIKHNEINLEIMYSCVLSGVTESVCMIPCSFSSNRIPPMKKSPKTEGSEKTITGKAILAYSNGN
jgi:hypothetical protein